MQTRQVATLEQLEPVAAELAALAKEIRILTFSGDLGSGKTTLIRSICRELGIEEPVTSPSFGLVNDYESPEGPVHHFDLYRLKDKKEALDLGFLDYLDSGNICLIEWPEIVAELLPSPHAALELRHEEEGKRTISWSEM